MLGNTPVIRSSKGQIFRFASFPRITKIYVKGEWAPGEYCPKTFYPHIGQYGYQKTQNFMLIPNLKMKLRKSAPIKSYLKKNSKKADFVE